jgi:hypothetical protein
MFRHDIVSSEWSSALKASVPIRRLPIAGARSVSGGLLGELAGRISVPFFPRPAGNGTAHQNVAGLQA